MNTRSVVRSVVLCVVLLGGAAAMPSPAEAMPVSQAWSIITSTFQQRMGRPMNQSEVDATIQYAQSLGWNPASPEIADHIVTAILDQMRLYTGWTIPEAGSIVEGRFVARYGRNVTSDEWRMLWAEAGRQGYAGSGNVPVDVLNRVLGVIDRYQPMAIDPASNIAISGKTFLLNGQRHPWFGITNFLLFYDWVHRPNYALPFIDFCVMHNIRTPRVSMAVSAEWLNLVPRSGVRFGLDRTLGLDPWRTPNFWEHMRQFLRYANSRGLTPEMVVYLTAGPLDNSTPQFQSPQGRRAFLEEAAHQLAPVRAFTVEIANEYNHIGFDLNGVEIVNLGFWYNQIDPLRQIALSSPPSNSVGWEQMAQGHYMTVHASRAVVPVTYQWVMDMFFLPHRSVNKPLINDESNNADTVGESGNDPDPRNSYAAGVMTRLLDMGYTYHYDRGLHGQLPDYVDNSLHTVRAWLDGMRDGDAPGALFWADPGAPGPGSPLPSSGSARGVVGRVDHATGTGIALFVGTPAGFVPPFAPGWALTLHSDRGTHRLYRLTRQ